jgi:hypothetical protein
LRLWVLTKPGCEFALDLDRCVQILDECGFLPTARFGVLDFCGIPDGLSAEELEKFLRERARKTEGLGTSSGIGCIIETGAVKRATKETP